MRAYTENDKKRLALQLQDLADAYKGFYKTDSEANYHNFLTSIMKKINGELDAQNVPLKLKLPFSLAGSVETWMDRTEGKRNGARVGGVRNW